MPPTAAPLPTPEHSDDRSSSRSLDEIGAVTVLGAMVEQRRHDSSALSPGELGVDADDADAIATQRRPRLDPQSDLFQKIR